MEADFSQPNYPPCPICHGKMGGLVIAEKGHEYDKPTFWICEDWSCGGRLDTTWHKGGVCGFSLKTIRHRLCAICECGAVISVEEFVERLQSRITELSVGKKA